MNRFICITIVLLTTGIYSLSAQDKKWTLEDCIDYAIENNIGLLRQGLITETNEAALVKSRMDLLPSLNIGSDAGVGFGRLINKETNVYSVTQQFSNSYSLNSSLQLFNGFTTLNTIAANKYMLKAGIESEKVARNTLIINIMGQFYQVLYAKGLEQASRMQLDLSEKQLFRISKMVETGKESVSKKYEIESQVSGDKLTYTIAKNNSSQALTTLRQLLQLEPSYTFDILMPDMDTMLFADIQVSTDSIYNIASQVLPRLKAIEYELEANDKQLAAAKGYIIPNLTAGGAVYTSYNRDIKNDSITPVPFSNQMKDNIGQTFYLSLNIPIFNNYTSARNIRLAKIRKSDTELRLELERNNLYAEIENACLSYSRGKDEYLTADANLKYNRKSFYTVEKKFESGLVDVTDYSASKTSLFSAEAEALRTRLQLLIRQLTIQFYSTGEYENIILN